MFLYLLLQSVEVAVLLRLGGRGGSVVWFVRYHLRHLWKKASEVLSTCRGGGRRHRRQLWRHLDGVPTAPLDPGEVMPIDESRGGGRLSKVALDALLSSRLLIDY